MKKKRQYRSNQGRSDKKMEQKYKVACLSIWGLIITFIFILLTQ
jgi:hypothetical protein